jgi:hypothetical protein
MRQRYLPGIVLQNVAVCSLQDTWHAAADFLESRRMLAKRRAASACLDAD